MINMKQHKNIRELSQDNENKIPLSFFGCFEKQKRKKLGYSLENISKDLSISKGNLSEMENEIRPMKKEVFKNFLMYFKIPFNEDPHWIVEMKTILIDFVDAFLRFDDKKEKKVREHFASTKGNWENSYACFLGLLVRYFEETVLDHKENDALFQELIVVRSCFSNDEKALLHMIRGIEGRWNAKLGNTEAQFEKALMFVDEKEFFGLKSLIGYYQIGEMIREKATIDTYSLCETVRKAFYVQHNYIRALYLDNLEALCVFRVHQLKSAYARFQALLANMEYVNDPYLRFCVSQNAILVLCVMEEFQQALDMMKAEKETFKCGLSNFVYAPYCLYRLGKTERAKNAIEEIRPYCTNIEDKLRLKLVNYALKKDGRSFFKTAEHLLKLDLKNRSQETAEVTYQLMIYFCKENNLNQKLIEAQEAYIIMLTK